MTATPHEKSILAAIRDIIGGACKKNGFSKGTRAYWWRIRDDAIHAIHLDRRVVGRHPYFVEVSFDFISAGGVPGGSLNMMPVNFRIERTMSNQEVFLTALTPGAEFGSLERRCEFIENILQDKINKEIDPIVRIAALKELKVTYKDDNILTIALRIENLM